jgi:CHAT domain-containing protein
MLRDVLEVAVREGDYRTLRHASHRLGVLLLNAGEYADAAFALNAAVMASEGVRDQQQDQETRLAERMGDEDIFLLAAAAHLAAEAPLEAVVVLEHLRARELLAARGARTDGPPVLSLQAVRKAVDVEHALLYVWALEDRTFGVLLLSGNDDDSFVVAISATEFLAVPTDGLDWGTPVVGSRPVGGAAAADDLREEVLGRGGKVVLGRAGAVPDFGALAPAFAELAAPWSGLLRSRQVRALRVVACGPLSNLPWGLLPAADGGPLANHLVVTYPPSASWLGTDPPLGRPKMSTVVVADTDPSRPLRYAAAEADEIARLEGAFRADPKDSDRLGVLALLLRARRLHLACHGDAEPALATGTAGAWLPVTVADVISRPADDPKLGAFLDSRFRRPAAVAVALANSELLRPEDLTPITVAGTELVVLAGCDTGLLARQRLSDELFGLPAAFLRAGAHAVIAALWPVSDDATALLMVRFHELLDGGLPSPDSLHHAQLWLANEAASSLLDYIHERSHLDLLDWPRIERAATDEHPYENPEHWAAFVYIG